ncbi:MAG: hypothetical protein AB8H80_19405, partial [Planctomycetota bacterium]
MQPVGIMRGQESVDMLPNTICQDPKLALDPLKKAVEFAAGEQAESLRWLPQFDLWIEQIVGVAALVAICMLILFATRALRVLGITRLIRHTQNTWDDIFVDKAFFRWISYMPPTLIGAAIAHKMPGLDESFASSATILKWIKQVLTCITTLTGMLAIGALFDAGHEIWNRRAKNRSRPIKGYISLLKIFVYVIGTVAAVAFLFGRNPSGLLLSLGAFTAVLLLIFKDT